MQYNAYNESYADFTGTHYGHTRVVFDGYGEGPLTKDNTHQRRGQKLHAKNKVCVIALISAAVTKKGCHVIQSLWYADVDIVEATVERYYHWTTTLVGDDTDLLLHYSSTDNEIICVRSDAKKHLRERKGYNINLLKETLGNDLCNELLFVHAYSGCDYTSRIFSIGKKSTLQKLEKSYSCHEVLC